MHRIMMLRRCRTIACTRENAFTERNTLCVYVLCFYLYLHRSANIGRKVNFEHIS